jgi:hypothetical protein
MVEDAISDSLLVCLLNCQAKMQRYFINIIIRLEDYHCEVF